MFLTGISLQHFRNYTNQTFFFHKPLTIIQAPNASGKTNILEAIHMLSTGASFRDGTIDDFIQIDQEYGRIKAALMTGDDEKSEVELLLSHGTVGGKSTQKKIFSINGVRKQLRHGIGQLSCVSFIPEDLRIITGSPTRRRKFLDTLLSQLDQEYIHNLTTYEQALRRRNKVLQQIREGETPRTALAFWDQSVLKHGIFVQEKRRALIDQLNLQRTECHNQSSIINVQTSSNNKFQSSKRENLFDNFSIEYDSSVISEARLQQYAQAEIGAGHTLVGPHKDDIVVRFSIGDSRSRPMAGSGMTQYPLSTHGSRGQQRMGVLWLKIGSFELLKQKNGTPPVLLLDDIFSELDRENRSVVLQLAQHTQTIMTTAEEEMEVRLDQESDKIRLNI